MWVEDERGGYGTGAEMSQGYGIRLARGIGLGAKLKEQDERGNPKVVRGPCAAVFVPRLASPKEKPASNLPHLLLLFRLKP